MMTMTVDELMVHFDEMDNDHAMTADGFDGAIIGAGEDCSGPVVIYDYDKVIEILVAMDMDWDTQRTDGAIRRLVKAWTSTV